MRHPSPVQAVDHAFHYADPVQSLLWLKVHRRHSPAARSRTLGIYRRIAHEAARTFCFGRLNVVALGCGGSPKDIAVLRAFHNSAATLHFTPLDVSATLSALSEKKAAFLPARFRHPLVANLRDVRDLPRRLDRLDRGIPRLYTCYGLLPNFEPDEILPLLAGWLRAGDALLLSANLAPVRGSSASAYAAAMRKILPQYRNPETQQWLTHVLKTRGWKDNLKQYRMRIETVGNLKRFRADVRWKSNGTVLWKKRRLRVRAGETLRLFFSWRHTPERLRSLLLPYGLVLGKGFLNPSREEGVWIVHKE
jgi:L-histidine N-alpha-methyltransferase